MKKFTKEIDDKEKCLDFKKDKKQKTISNDVEKLNDQISDNAEKDKLNGKWEIVNVLDVSLVPPKTNEAIIINGELGNKEIKRGDLIYITAQIKRPGQTVAYHNMQMGVVKVRVVDIYNTMSILNNLI